MQLLQSPVLNAGFSLLSASAHSIYCAVSRSDTRMNNKQRAAVLAGTVAFIAVGLFPPWICCFNGGPVLEGGRHYQTSSRPIGHHLIFAPPRSNDGAYYQELFDGATLDDPRFYEFKIDAARLTVLWISVVVASVALVILLRR